MKLTPAIVLSLCGVASGWSVCSPKRIIQRKIKKGLLVGGAVVVAGTATVAAGAVGAAVVANQLNNGEVYEPAAGSMNDQVVVITGGSSGLGLETAKRLSAAGATVVLTSRTVSKGEKAVDVIVDYLIGKEMDSSNVYSLPLDLDDLSNVKQFAASYATLGLGDISVLVNNAGVMAIPDRELTVDGNERTFQSNHLGHFVLTSELYSLFSRKGTKVINVSSSASNFAAPGLDMDNLNGETSYGAWKSYGISKLANILFTTELQRKASEAGEDWLTTVALHPGVVNTDLWRYIVGEDRLNEIKENDSFSIESLALSATSLFTKSPEQGASTQIFLASQGNLVKGAFYEEMKEKKNVPTFAKDEDKAKALWEVSEELGSVRFDLTMKDDSEVVDAPQEDSHVEESLDDSGVIDASQEESPIEDSLDDNSSEEGSPVEDSTEDENNVE